MKIQILSDLHNEFGLIDFEKAPVDLLIAAGDIDNGTKGLKWLLSLNLGIPIIYVLGNHEYYDHAYPGLISEMKALARGTNVQVLEDDSVQFGEITFHGATLWSNFELYGDPKVAGMVAQLRMNDYAKIKLSPGNSELRAVDTLRAYHQSFRWLTRSLTASTTPYNVVVTHHAPSEQSLPRIFKGEALGAAFATNLESFIIDKAPDLWVHGHLHGFRDYSIGKTRVIANPRGYPQEPDWGWQERFVVELGD